MALETATYIDGLVATNPVATDQIAVADDHMRLIKSTIKASFPNIAGAMTADHNELSVLDGITANTSELNILDGVTATTAEINYLSGVTSAIQTQLNTLSTTVSAVNTDLDQDTSPQLSADLDTNGNAIQFGSWTIEANGTYLSFYYGGNEKFRMKDNGDFHAEADVGAYTGI